MKYIKKPIPIEVSEPWLKEGDNPDVIRFIDFIALEDREKECLKCGFPLSKHGRVETLEGGHIVCPGDRIITGVEGEKYPIKPGIFEKTYRPAN